MKTFSIAELERYSLIKAHTFRAWEQRFDVFKSRRKLTNRRFYTIEDLAFLLDFALLNRLGNKVSVLAQVDKYLIRQKVLYLNEGTARKEHQINQLIICMFSLNIEDFELTLDSAVSAWGIDATIKEVILPFLDRLQLFSYKGHTNSEYHFVVTALRKKMILGIEQARPQRALPKTALLFLPGGEHFDLLLLYTTYKVRIAGLNVLYLGTNISIENLKTVIEKKQPHFLITHFSSAQEKIVKQMAELIPVNGAEVFFITGTKPEQRSNPIPPNFSFVSYREMDSKLLAFSEAFRANEGNT